MERHANVCRCGMSELVNDPLRVTRRVGACVDHALNRDQHAARECRNTIALHVFNARCCGFTKAGIARIDPALHDESEISEVRWVVVQRPELTLGCPHRAHRALGPVDSIRKIGSKGAFATRAA